MTRREFIDFCRTFASVYEEYPFKDIIDSGKIAIIAGQKSI